MRNKKAISIALSAVMAFTTAFGMTTVKANAEEKEKLLYMWQQKEKMRQAQQLKWERQQYSSMKVQ